MADTSHQTQRENKKIRNWIKAGLGLKYVKEGLEPFCDDIVKQQHSDSLTKVKNKHNLSTVNCGLCNLRTLQPDHVRDKSKQCPLRQSKCNCQYPGGKVVCPNSVCGGIYDEIVQLYASKPPVPCWKNSDAQKWCTEPWAVAKCFINAPGYTQMSKASEIDCSGLLHVLVNNKGLQRHLNTVITGTDVFSKLRRYRNAIFHSSCMELEENDINMYIDDMIAALQDDKELKAREESKSAVKSLLELKNDDFVITANDEAEVQATLKTIRDKEMELEKKVHDYMDNIDFKAANATTFLQQAGEDIQSEVLLEMKQTGTNIQAEIEQTGKYLKHELEESFTNPKDTGKIISKKQYAKKKKDNKYSILDKSSLRPIANITCDKQKNVYSKNTSELVAIYKDHATKASALPLLPERDKIDIRDVYVTPLMTEEVKTGHSRNIAIHEIFETEEKLLKNIYVLGEAGSGKSALCKSLISQWCLAHSKGGDGLKERDANKKGRTKGSSADKKGRTKGRGADKKGSPSKGKIISQKIKSFINPPSIEEIVKTMKKFEFLFYISLRHSTDCSNVETMLHDVYQDPVLNKILEKESHKCLILLDGLDEWTVQLQKPSQFQTLGIPSRNLKRDYTIITTSRQWKFDSLQIKDSEISRIIKLQGIDEHSVRALSEKTVGVLNDMLDEDKVVDDFTRALQRSPVADMSQNPMILQQLICLWYDGNLKGTSKCAIYCSMLNLYFERAALRHYEKRQIQTRLEASYNLNAFSLPEVLRNYDACCRNVRIIQNLSCLAFETLFSLKREHRLTFPSSIFEHLNISDDADTCLKIGLLSVDQGVAFLSCKRRSLSFSFIHKSIQEYFAAVYIASEFEKLQSPAAIGSPQRFLHPSPKPFEDRRTETTASTTEERCSTFRKFIHQYFESCKTVNDVLEQSDVFMMLCGFT